MSERAVKSGSAVFAQTYLLENLGSIRKCSFISDSNPLKGIGNLTIHASNEDDPYVTLKDDVRFYSLIQTIDCNLSCILRKPVLANLNNKRGYQLHKHVSRVQASCFF